MGYNAQERALPAIVTGALARATDIGQLWKLTNHAKRGVQ
jgi:hypothetical protein